MRRFCGALLLCLGLACSGGGGETTNNQNGDNGNGGGEPPPPVVVKPVITTNALPNADEQLPYYARLTATGDSPPFTWDVAGRPAWLLLDRLTGVLRGRPTAAATFPLTVTVTDLAGETATKALSLVVRDAPAPQPVLAMAATRDVQSGAFRTSVVCRMCHTNTNAATAMRDAANRAIAPVDLWRASMMGNAGRNPYFRAVFAAELAANTNPAAVEGICLRCHAPMDTQPTLADLYRDTTKAQLALDAVSCTVCHQIQANPQFDGGFVIASGKPAYGPHANPFGMPMVSNTGYTPTQASHTTASATCGGCHTLFTDSAGGAHFPEQTPYLEWLNSNYGTAGHADFATCADCHIPTVDEDGKTITTKIATRPSGGDFPPIGARQPYGRHVLVGGNTLVLGMLKTHAADLNPAGPVDSAITATRTQLQQATASVALRNAALNAGVLTVDVRVENHTGHKFPTAYPSRRAWLRLAVKDDAGATVFASGAYDAHGAIVGPNGQPLAFEGRDGPFEPHRDAITGEDEVQIYQAVMGDDADAINFVLLRAARYLKDNRLLPHGWGAKTRDIAPIGTGGDANFTGGFDTVSYRVGGLGAGPYTIEVALLYESIAPRHACELFTRSDVREVNVFRQYYLAADRTPEVIATASQSIP